MSREGSDSSEKKKKKKKKLANIVFKYHQVVDC